MAEGPRQTVVRQQIHAIRDELAKLAKDFARFNERLRVLAVSIQRAHEDIDRAKSSSEKLAKRFTAIAKGKSRAKRPISSP